MAKIRVAYACSLASLATVLLGSASFPQFALAQTAAATNSNTATAGTNSTNRRGPVDPGVRGGDPGAGGPLPGLSPDERAFFEASREFFAEVEGIPDGLGPRLNLDGCASCHIHPVVGGTSPAINPQVAFATSEGKQNVVPSFITTNGPIREARFVRNRDGSPDGAVHQLFVITGHADAAGCNIRQPDFAAEVARNNVIFRIPTPVFGLGLVEGVTDASLEANLAANANQKRSLGISGRLNRNPNDGTTSRFGWKAQVKSLLLFSGEAYNVEQGITSELFPQEVELDPNCDFAPDPDSPTPLTPEETGSPSANFQSDIIMFAAFMRLIGPAIPASSTAVAATQPASSTTTVASAAANVASVLPSAAGSTTGSATSTASTSSTATVARGRQVFSNVGCAACHTVSLTTGRSSITGQSNVTFQPFSDFALHDMGDGLADRVSQGLANGREFRTVPLWGVGQRIFFLHDGRTNDLVEAIRQHASRGSEANEVIQNYHLLSTDDKQSLVNFLRSL